MPQVFISYVRENSEDVKRLVRDLEAQGVEVWFDQKSLYPGDRWADVVRRAISQREFFIACFSSEYQQRSKSFMNEEITQAIEQLRQRPTDRRWFIPVRLSDCEIPDRSIGGGQTLQSIQCVSLHENWDEGVRSILSVVQPPSKNTPETQRRPWHNALIVVTVVLAVTILTAVVATKWFSRDNQGSLQKAAKQPSIDESPALARQRKLGQLNGPPGTVWSLGANPMEPKVLYAGTEGRGVFKSKDGGHRWTEANAGLELPVSVRQIVLNPKNPSILYALTDHGHWHYGLHKSENGASTWMALETGSECVESLVMDQEDPNVLYACMRMTALNARKTSDGGETWEELPIRDVRSIVVDSSNSRILYAGTEGGRVFKSEDAGHAWSEFDSRGWIHWPVTSLAHAAANSNSPAYLYVGTSGGGLFPFVKYSDASWDIARDELLPGHVNCLTYGSGVIYAGTKGDGVFRRGVRERWTPINLGLTNMAAWSLLSDPRDTAVLYLATDGGIFKTENRGSRWARLGEGILNSSVRCLIVDSVNPNLIYAATESGVFKTEDAGDSWSEASSGLPTHAEITSLAAVPYRPDTIYASTWFDVYESVDGGMHWTAASVGLPAYRSHLDGLSVNANDPRVLYVMMDVASHESALYKSDNGAESWTRISAVTYGILGPLAIDQDSPDNVYLWECSGTGGPSGVFRSIDGGENWKHIADDLKEIRAQPLVMHAMSPDTLYGVFREGLFKVADMRVDWRDMNLGSPDIEPYAFAISREQPHIWYLGTSKGAYWSVDEGQTWKNVLGVPSKVVVRSVAVDPRLPGVVYAGTEYHGIFRGWANLNEPHVPR